MSWFLFFLLCFVTGYLGTTCYLLYQRNHDLRATIRNLQELQLGGPSRHTVPPKWSVATPEDVISDMEEAIKISRDDDGPFVPMHNPAYDKNQPCQSCGAIEGTFRERGFNRCNKCGYPGQ